MHVSTLGLCIFCISGATLVTALPSSQGATTNGRQDAPNAVIPPYESGVLVDGVEPATERDILGVSLSSPKGDLASKEKSGKENSGLQARQAEAVALIGVTGLAVLFTASAFVSAAAGFKGLVDFREARKKFTSTQVEEMWKRNPDYNKFPAAACYSLVNRLANPAVFDQLANITLSAGVTSRSGATNSGTKQKLQ
ncbi:uncharacterized protein GLRG_11582 [Colletotrichum graminicola M1.001]|uniref:DUF7888 domain-containing protein n=1 Tax=Colletotrichum graminicola (strain M1.001 / M2 / FGSC 10212) TaxID=645133 RepID=E3QZZ9_COLGM|nr:uncharacterized protein GLRG_11582 [Colletotrichum graminicola M1.001]EFQ36437.1 hypothetical protein GLRG_11582 [Colletotrichum graminicola M1.001]